MTVTSERPRTTSSQLPLGHLLSTSPSADFAAMAFVLDSDGWRVYLDDSLERWGVYVDTDNHRTFVHPDLWTTLLWGPAKVQFCQDFVWTATSGMRFLIRDSGIYGEAARREAQRMGTDVPLAKERLADLTDRANALIVQAISLNAQPTEVQQQTFAVRYTQLHEEFVSMEAEMDKVRGLIDLASAALIHACAP